MSMEAINLEQKFSLVNDYWSPKIIGRLNDFHVKLVKVKGEFVWHHHDTEDEMFLVVKGRFLVKLRDRDIWLNEGEMTIIPHGIEHTTYAEEEVHLLLLEPATTVNTGSAGGELTAGEEWV